MRNRKSWKRFLSVILIASIITTTAVPPSAVSAATVLNTEKELRVQQVDSTTEFQTEDASTATATTEKDTSSESDADQSKEQDNADASQSNNDADESKDQNDKETSTEESTASTASKDDASSDEKDQKPAADTKLYQNGSICIYNEQQLRMIGTKKQVYEGDASEDSFGTGAALTKEDGDAFTYDVDASYTLMDDISLKKGTTWELPEGFKGTFNGEKVTTDAKLYDRDTDTIYVYNQYQLATINDKDALKNVMSKDMIAKDFGIGQVVYEDENQKIQLEYTEDHNYVISKNFTEDMPELTAAKVQDASAVQLGGREFVGQAAVKMDGKIYILIGNEQQLRAIGDDETYVNPMLFEKTGNEYRPIYPGDADLNITKISDAGLSEADMTQADFKKSGSLHSDDNIGKKDGISYTYHDYVMGMQNETPVIVREDDPDYGLIYEDLTYAADANYIIFRNIDLKSGDYSNNKDDHWNPITFSGNMEGRLNMQEGNKPAIENITVVQDTAIDISKNTGIGFFGTITNEVSDDNLGLSAGTAKVKNIILDKVAVDNQTKTIKKDLSLIELLLGVLLNPLLHVKETAPDTFATGSFAGRIVGDVEVSGCEVKDAEVKNVADMTGGFAGNVEGVAEYQGLQGAIGGILATLETVLNIIPGLGLGDLITILLNNPEFLNVTTLLPTGYKKAVIDDCSVSMSQTEIENAGQKFVGGFAGAVTGANISRSSVNNLAKVTAEKYAGGFSGITRDATIKALLSDIGISIDWSPSSTIESCDVNDQDTVNLTVSSKTDYAGGFTGVVANSSIRSSNVNGLTSVTAGKDYAGGFTGRATVGYASVLGETDEADTSLLESVSKLLTDVTAGDLSGDLLTLVGIQPSKLDGCSVSGSDFTVEASGDYAGGFFAQADGVIMNGDTQSKITGIKSVTAQNYAGGISGKAATANAAGVLNNTLGIGEMLAFSAKNILLTGGSNGLTVTTTKDYAGGAFGQAIGGTVSNVTLKEVSKVSANNYAGGFAGDAGTGSLVEGGGLNLLGLNLVKIDHLLSLAKGVVLNINNSSVDGGEVGLSVLATGANAAGTIEDFVAGGFIGESKSVVADNCNVENLKSVTADTKDGYAGGFTGTSESGGLADIAKDKEGIEGLASLNDLLSAGSYLIPKYNNCHVTYTSNTSDQGQEAPQVNAAVAGGFAGEMNSGKVNAVEDVTVSDAQAVKNLQYVKGTYFAGGFTGIATSGGLAESGGLSLLGGAITLNGIGDLIKVLEVYMPIIQKAGVTGNDEKGFIVETSETKIAQNSNSGEESDTNIISANAGSAGGYVGYGCGVQISDSNVKNLRATDITGLESEESEDGSSYFSQKYAVSAPKYAGGYAGKLDIGNAASLGSGLELLGSSLSVTDLTEALAIVASKIKNSDVTGNAGGFSVVATEQKDGAYTGYAGGYVGMMSGADITSSDVDQFNYIIGGTSAGGYVGTLEPGNVASVLGDASILDGLINAENLLSALETFVPKITTSTTGAVPCGGVVRAENGSAGGYAGHSLGGQIKGTNKNESAILRIRSVYGQKYAGGFTGFAETANLVDTGNLKVLGGLLKVDNPLSALQLVYAQEENTAVYGPLRNMDYKTWNGWVEHIGANGPYGDQFKDKTFENQTALNEFLEDYIYGYEVFSSGADEKDGVRQTGYAGGYVGMMTGAQITNGHAKDLMKVKAWKSAGGFAGLITPASLASVGGIAIADLDLTNKLDVLQTMVPVIKKSGVSGYRSGAFVQATGYKEGEKAGYAGGFVGNMIGGQIWGEESSCEVKNITTVKAKNAVGGFAGQILPGSAASVDTSSSNALLDGLLNSVIDTNDDLASVLNATLATVKNVTVKTDHNMGIRIQGAYEDGNETAYATSAGGFAGNISGAVIGDKDGETKIVVQNLQIVNGGEYAGGFAGKADVSAVAEVSGESDTNILGQLVKLGGADVLDIMRPYIYHAEVSGTDKYGIEVRANEGKQLTDHNEDAGLYSGNAGGFIGSLLCGTVKNSSVKNLRNVKALNYSGGFIGHMGKSGLVDADGADILDKIVDAGVGFGDVIGSDANECTVTGISDGFTVKSTSGKNEISGGFVGYADLGRMENNTVDQLKKVSSDQIAGGFVGKTSYEYLVNAEVSGEVTQLLSQLLNALLKQLLHADNLQKGDVVYIDLGVVKVAALWDGKLLSANLLGIPITASLVEGQSQIKVTIGDSDITLGYQDETGTDPSVEVSEEKLSELVVHLIKANRTKITDSTVSGIDTGYDVFGGGASNTQDGTDATGYAGGFVGFNNEGLLTKNKMIKADTIRGTKKKVGEFDGGVSLETVWGTEISDIEKENTYQVYRLSDEDQLTTICNSSGNVLGTAQQNKATVDGKECYLYTINHMSNKYLMSHENWKDAYQSPSETSNAKFPVKVYVSDAQADLMLGTPTQDNISDPDKIGDTAQDPCEPGKAELTIQKLWIDNNNSAGKRPETIDLTLTPKEENESSGTIHVSLSKKDEDAADSNTWIKQQTIDLNTEYEAKETLIDGYTTTYEWSKDENGEKGYTLYITNYLNDELVQEDSVVIDYGLPVDVDVLANDRVNEISDKAELEAVSAKGTESTSESEKTTAKGKYGTAKIEESQDDESEKKKSIIEYKPTSMEMDSFDQFEYTVNLNSETVDKEQSHVTGSLTVIPATEIYYEDNVGSISYQNGTVKEGSDSKNGTWEVVGKADTDRHQDTDRPGLESLKENMVSVYGNDTHYANDATYSGGAVQKVTVGKENLTANGGTNPCATFNFTGTGFDVISVTSGDSGTVSVRVINTATGKPVKSKTVDTYYGYTYTEEEGWKVDKDSKDALYQIPIIKMEGLEWGTYKVEITPMYFSVFDNKDAGEYSFYLDAIRVYDPADPNAEGYETIQNAYISDKENNSQFLILRKFLLNAGDLSGNHAANGAVFVDGKAEDVTLAEYASYGPKNEVYLMRGQAIAFYLETDQIPDSIHLSAKLAKGESANLQIACAVPEGDQQEKWNDYRKQNATIATAYDMHYNLSDQCVWEGDETSGFRTKYPIVISNVSSEEDTAQSGSIISLTNLNWTSASIKMEKPSSAELKVVTDQNVAKAAYSLLSSRKKPEVISQQITVQYVDTEGNVLADEAVQAANRGEDYDATELTKKEITGYQQIQFTGDSIQGTADGDKVIQVVYEKQQYSIEVAHVDRNGNAVADSYVSKALYGSNYDISSQVNKKIRGYKQAEINGNEVSGIVKGDVKIIVVYEKEKNIITGIVNTITTVVNNIFSWLFKK